MLPSDIYYTLTLIMIEKMEGEPERENNLNVKDTRVTDFVELIASMVV